MVTANNLCKNVICSQGLSCDGNTGKCAKFRQFNYEFANLCSNIECPGNTKCDTNTGFCVLFRNINL
ncbi:unnamed protein product [Dracunculus medinensis]|uniref:EB domain-containing protein n=1 Tax=Dracunculus medinensis TaxID=318479 RepID=A0A0N4U3V8_DRAME|nr:unnamed protein product [Dracunculus medinensis]